MNKILLILSILITTISFGQINIKPNYTKPYFQGNVKVADTLGVYGGAIFTNTDSILYEEDFEGGTLGDFTTSPVEWTVDLGKGAGGSSNSARSGVIGNDTTTSMSITKTTVSEYSFINFDYDLSTEDGWDGFQVYIDTVLVFDIRISTGGFVNKTIAIRGAGSHTIEFRYRKDVNAAGGSDAVWIDNFKLIDPMFAIESNGYSLFNKVAIFNSDLIAANVDIAEGLSATNALLAGNVTAKSFSVVTASPEVTAEQGVYSIFKNDAVYTLNQNIEGFKISDASSAGATLFLDVGDARNNTGNQSPYGYLQLRHSGGYEQVGLVAQSKANGASHINSRLQVGYNTSTGDQSNTNTLDVNGNISTNEGYDIETGTYKLRLDAATITTSDKTQTFQDKNGEIALLSDIGGVGVGGLYSGSGSMSVGVDVTATMDGDLTFKRDYNGASYVTIENVDGGSNASATLALNSDVGFCEITKYSFTSPLSGEFELINSGGDISFAIPFGNQKFRFEGSGGIAATINSSTGDVGIGIGSDTPLGRVHVGGSGSGSSVLLYLENASFDDLFTVLNDGTTTIKGTVVNPTGSIADNDATPDVRERNIWTYAGTGNSVILTDLDNPTVGATYTIIGNSDTYTLTINSGGNFKINGGIGITLGADDVAVFRCVSDNNYLEISRSFNQ